MLCLLCDTFAKPAVETNPLNAENQEAKKKTDGDGDTLLKEIKDLETQKNDLYDEINKAIDESIIALNKSNDTDAVTGVNYIKDLKKQIKEISGLENADAIYNEYDKRVNTSFLATNDKNIFLDKIENGDSENTRRKIKSSKKNKSERGSNNEADRFLQDAQKELDRLLNKGLTGAKLKERLERREKIRHQLEEWIKMKDLERQKIKEYQEKLKKGAKQQEQCPRSGHSKSKKKSKRGDHGCCRKCCKRSYMGCLKK